MSCFSTYELKISIVNLRKVGHTSLPSLIELGIGLIELGIGLMELGIGPRINNAQCTVLARISGLVSLVFKTVLIEK